MEQDDIVGKSDQYSTLKNIAGYSNLAELKFVSPSNLAELKFVLSPNLASRKSISPEYFSSSQVHSEFVCLSFYENTIFLGTYRITQDSHISQTRFRK